MKYEPVQYWPKAPAGWDLIDVPAVAADSKDRVYLFSRGQHPVLVFDAEGNFLTSWGEGVFSRPHGICIGPDDLVYCVDDYDHTLRKFTPDGQLLMTVGRKGEHSDTGAVWGDYLSVQRGGGPFYRPTSVALSPEGHIYVTDGYLNARVHKFSPEGELLASWGAPGSGPGQFRLVHGICVDRDGVLYVGDRMNSRVQVFSPQGEFMSQWNNVYQPNDICIDSQGNFVIAELGYRADLPMPGPIPSQRDYYPRVTVRNSRGEIQLSLFHPNPGAPGGFFAPHGLRTDSKGSIYVAEVSGTHTKELFLDYEERRHFNLIQKFARVD